MNRFAELLDRLAYEPGRNNKLRLITAYFRDTPDPDRGYALAALTGALSFKHAKPGLIRELIASRSGAFKRGRDSSPTSSSSSSPLRSSRRIGAGSGISRSLRVRVVLPNTIKKCLVKSG